MGANLIDALWRMSLPPRGAWIEISKSETITGFPIVSLPPRGAWIEINDYQRFREAYTVAPPTGSVDRNSTVLVSFSVQIRSLPPRGAWIEIPNARNYSICIHVAPPTGSVDRNHSSGDNGVSGVLVAPPTGSVDRNRLFCVQSCWTARRSPHGERG